MYENIIKSASIINKNNGNIERKPVHVFKFQQQNNLQDKLWPKSKNNSKEQIVIILINNKSNT